VKGEGGLNNMGEELEKLAREHGDRLKVIPVKHLADVKKMIEEFKNQEELNNFQKWIVNDLYQFELPQEEFSVNSIILTAIHHPFCAKVTLEKEGEKITVLSLVKADFKNTEEYLGNYLKEKEYKIKTQYNLPLKRLGVHSGLAKYGRNNITYIDGLGSNFSYAAYLTDMVCEEDTWGDLKNAKACGNCSACIKICPTGAIRKDRFLIDNQKCLPCMNEMPGEFPEWLPVSVHHTLYDCLYCQQVCPMNRDQMKDVVEEISFTEEETNMLLEGRPIDSFSVEAKLKIYQLGLDDWYDAIPRNLKALFSKA
jgi:epoxyqueuosine reductase